MESKGYKSLMMDYLYGEMSTADILEFEKMLDNDAELRQEYNALKAVRDELSHVGDDGSMEAFNISSQVGMNWPLFRKRRIFTLRPIIAVAASLIILMLLGYLTDFAIEADDRGVRIGFFNSAANSMSEEDLKNMIAREMADNTAAINQTIENDRENLNAQLSDFENRLIQKVDAAGKAVNSKQLAQISAQFEKQNVALLQQYFGQATLQQQEYFSAMLTQFNDYLQEQRAEDLNMLQAGLLEIKYDQTRQNIETQEAIAALFTKVNNRQN